MKRTACLAVLAFAALWMTGCGRESTEPTWTGTLENTGVSMTAWGGAVSESAATLYPEEGSEGEELLLLTAEDVVTLSWEEVQPEDIAIAFVRPEDGSYREYSESDPIEKVDYVPLETEESSLQYRFDTAYSFVITVTTEQGTDRILLEVHRKI